VQPHIDYCSQLWAFPEKIQNLAKSFTAKNPAVKHLDYLGRLRKLKMTSQHKRLKKYK
jgi:hypothetical protein